MAFRFLNLKITLILLSSLSSLHYLKHSLRLEILKQLEISTKLTHQWQPYFLRQICEIRTIKQYGLFKFLLNFLNHSKASINCACFAHNYKIKFGDNLQKWEMKPGGKDDLDLAMNRRKFLT
jgi:hypothetical protein